MQCPKCSYVMDDLETECLRCKRTNAGAVVAAPHPAELPPLSELSAMPFEKECPRCGKATTAEAETCDKCGYEYHPDVNRSERYQALLAEEANLAAAPSALRRTVPPALSWSIIGASLLAIGIAGWAMIGDQLTGDGDSDSYAASPTAISRHHKPHHTVLHTVTYQIAGTAARAIVTYTASDGVAVTVPNAVPLPWSQTFKAKLGTPLVVSAKASDPVGSVTIAIDVDGVPQKPAQTVDADGLLTAHDTL